MASISVVNTVTCYCNSIMIAIVNKHKRIPIMENSHNGIPHNGNSCQQTQKNSRNGKERIPPCSHVEVLTLVTHIWVFKMIVKQKLGY